MNAWIEFLQSVVTALNNTEVSKGFAKTVRDCGSNAFMELCDAITLPAAIAQAAVPHIRQGAADIRQGNA